MAVYKSESHYRSLLKGISWRIVATMDTIVIVLFLTCLKGACSIDDALKIGFYEFFIKLAVYYVHERIWQKILHGREVSPKTTLYKSIVWRIIASSLTFVISGTILNAFGGTALYIACIEFFSKFVLYYLHERLWLRIPVGKIRNYFYGNKEDL